MTTTSVQCHTCGSNAVPVTQQTELKMGSRSVLVDDEFMQCTNCGAEFYLPGQMEATQRRAAANARAAEGLLTPEEILGIREGLELSQADFEKLLGVGPKTVVRWERGTVFQNRATDSLLRLIGADRRNAEMLADRHRVTLKPPVSAPPVPPSPGPSFKDPVLKGAAAPGAANRFWQGKRLVIQVQLEDVTDSDRAGRNG